LFAVAWWWVTWPERTAQRFVELVQAQKLNAAQEMCRPPEGADALWAMASIQDAKIGQPTCLAPTWMEILKAQRRFEIPCTVATTTIVLDEFVATRSFVATNPENSQRTSTSYLAVTPVAAGILAQALERVYTDAKSFQFVADEPANRVLMRVPKQLATKVQLLCSALDRPQNFSENESPIYIRGGPDLIEKMKRIVPPH
jgi:hypothetical protein